MKISVAIFLHFFLQTMRKFTTIILLFCVSTLFCLPTKAQNWDIDFLRKVNQSSSTGWRNYSTFISNTTYVAVVAVPLVIGTTALIQHNDELLKDALYVGVSLGVTTALTYGLKHSINRERPYDTYSGQLYVPRPESSASFPSGHTSVAFATATALSLKYPKWYIIVPSYTWAASVGYSRMNLGVHYPSDVFAGAVLGTGSAYLTYKVNDWFWKKHENKKLIIAWQPF